MSRVLMALLAASSLAACASAGHPVAANANSDRSVADATSGAPAHVRPIDRHARQAIEREDMLTQMAFWAGEYQTFPNDLEAAQRFAECLRKGGRFDRSIQVSGEALGRFPDDRTLMNTFALAQIASGNPHEALRPLAVVAAADAQNWHVRLALGAALDQLGRYTEARQAYQEALAISPNNARVMTNLGVSHIMAGEPADAEPILRQAAAAQDAPPEARENLAIALALQGKFDEAQQIESVDLPPAQAAQNMQYLRGLLSDPRSWRDLRSPS